MPAPSGTKRVKNKRIARPYVIGSEAWPLDPANRPEGIPENHTTGWRVYVRNVEGGADLSVWLDKVTFKLFHTYTPPQRVVDTAPFEVLETGWGGFSVDVRLHFNPIAHEKPQWRALFLQLEPYGTEAEQAAQKAAKLVRSETCDFIEFNEPTEAFFDALTSESQWDYMDKKGKSKRGSGTGYTLGIGTHAGAGNERTVELPLKPTPSNPYSQQMEQETIDVLLSKKSALEELVQAEQKQEEEVKERVGVIREEVGPDALKPAAPVPAISRRTR